MTSSKVFGWRRSVVTPASDNPDTCAFAEHVTSKPEKPISFNGQHLKKKSEKQVAVLWTSV